MQPASSFPVRASLASAFPLFLTTFCRHNPDSTFYGWSSGLLKMSTQCRSSLYSTSLPICFFVRSLRKKCQTSFHSLAEKLQLYNGNFHFVAPSGFVQV